MSVFYTFHMQGGRGGKADFDQLVAHLTTALSGVGRIHSDIGERHRGAQDGLVR
jgi:hypothetical protein